MLHGFEGKVSTECWHAYACDVVLKKSREHVFLKGFLEVIHFWSRKHGAYASCYFS